MFLLGVLTWTTPLMLGGMVLLSLPIVAHVLNRRAQQTVRFPTIRFLKMASANQSQLFKFRRWILLLLRCLVVALIVAAFAEPMWQESRAQTAGDKEGTAVVLLLDVSASTGQDGASSTVAHALSAAGSRVLDSLTPGRDVANVVIVAGQAEAVFPVMSGNFPHLQQELANIQPTYERANLTQALTLCGELLAAQNRRGRIVVLSDLQATNWQETLQDLRQSPVLPPGTEVTIFEPSMASGGNIALSAPHPVPARPLLDQPCQLIVEAANFGPSPQQITLTAKVNSVPVTSQTLTLAAGEKREVGLPHTFSAGGQQLVEFSTVDSALAVDNRAYVVVQPVQRLPVLLISDDPPNEAGSSSYFLSRALSPRNDPTDHFQVQEITSRELATADLEQASVVFVGYLGSLSEDAAARLAEFVRRGGSMVYFCGEGDVRAPLARLAAALETPLGWQPGTLQDHTALDQGLFITDGQWRSNLLRQFNERDRVAFSHIRFHRTWSVADLQPQAQVLLAYSDGTPALTSQLLGSGQMLQANFSPALWSSDLGKYGSFVALVQILAKELQPQHLFAGSGQVGLVHRFPPLPAEDASPDATDDWQIVGPDTTYITPSISSENGRVVAHLPSPPQPGFYRLLHGGKDVSTAAVNLDPRESDLRPLPRETLEAGLQQEGTTFTKQTADAFQSKVSWQGQPLWGLCLLLAMVFLATELACLAWWRR